MHTLHHLVRPIATAMAAMFLTLAAGCSKPVDQGGAASATFPKAANASQAKAASKLGDLTEFRNIANDVVAMVDKGNLPAAKARIKDLEVAWDAAEAGLKPRAADDWHVLDKAIDHALASLRADAPTQADCKATMDTMLKTFDTLQGKN
ncbi:MAG: hypothetical protein EPO09_15040 [Aquabacterium sp.]|uniref:hypothetical protein n=1 Tax=Aquabacterium sp. TaxID=1872578 RepID=UPI001200D10E|nr:hypothetical protein [Aquabacterium sp.]TAK92683.1 MAG: hypothetical protein EPO09_15040 [Aquabacterium sp.]